MTVRREAGEELKVEVLCDEGVDSHIGPEPCVAGPPAGRRDEHGSGKRVASP